MRTLALSIVLACAACGKKPVAKAPAPPPAEATPPDADPAKRTTPAAPAPAPKPGDPCSGGEKPH